VWQMQHRPLAMPLSYLRTGYDRSPYERQAREAARRTAGWATGPGRAGGPARARARARRAEVPVDPLLARRAPRNGRGARSGV